MSKIIPTHTLPIEHDSPMFCKVEALKRPNPYDPGEAHRHSYYELFLFTQGGGTHMIDFQDVQIEEKTIHLVGPGQVHLVKRKEPSRGHVILFPESLFLNRPEVLEILFEIQYTDSSGIATRNAISDTSFEEAKNLVLLIKSELSTASSHHLDIARNLLHVFLIKCREWIPGRPQGAGASGERQVLKQYLSQVHQQFRELHSVSGYGDVLSISVDRLNQICKKLLGQTASHIIRERITLEAKRLLLHSSLSTKEIAYELNFEDPSYFSRFFKKETGQSPSVFRKDIRKKYPS